MKIKTLWNVGIFTKLPFYIWVTLAGNCICNKPTTGHIYHPLLTGLLGLWWGGWARGVTSAATQPPSYRSPAWGAGLWAGLAGSCSSKLEAISKSPGQCFQDCMTLFQGFWSLPLQIFQGQVTVWLVFNCWSAFYFIIFFFAADTFQAPPCAREVLSPAVTRGNEKDIHHGPGSLPS